MKKWPRWAKILLCLLLIFVSLLALSDANSGPSPTAEIEFRRRERQELIGPAEILGTFEMTYGHFTHTMLGKSDYGYTTLTWWGDGWKDGNLLYFPKTGETTLFCPGYDCSTWYQPGWQLPFFAFTDLPGAKTAVLTLTVTTEEGTETHRMEAELQQDGYFLFCLREETVERESLLDLILLMNPHYGSEGSVLAEMTVCNYQNEPIGTHTQDFAQN